MALRLDTLPEEIINEIFINVAMIDFGFNTSCVLLNLCITCKCFNKIATPLLVRNLRAIGTDSASRLRLFMRHLLQHPEYEMKVRYFSVNSTRIGIIEPSKKLMAGLEFSEDEIEALKRLARESILGNDAKFVKTISEGDGDAINDALLALFLIRTIRLELLLLNLSPRSYVKTFINKVAELLESEDAGPMLPLQNLRYVSLIGYYGASLYVNDYGTLFCLPRLSEISIHNVGTLLDTSRSVHLRPHVSNVKKLVITCDEIDFEGLNIVIESCKALKSLSITRWLAQRFYMEGFGRRLVVSQAHSLEELKIDQISIGNFIRRPCLENLLVGLTTLSSLHIHIESFYTYEEILIGPLTSKPLYLLLPASLKKLQIMQPDLERRKWTYGIHVIRILEQYISDILAHEEQKKLEYISAIGWLHPEDEGCTKLWQLCNEANIKLELSVDDFIPQEELVTS